MDILGFPGYVSSKLTVAASQGQVGGEVMSRLITLARCMRAAAADAKGVAMGKAAAALHRCAATAGPGAGRALPDQADVLLDAKSMLFD